MTKKTKAPQIGDEKVIAATGLFQIIRRVVRVAYARNGNTHNPTPYYNWDVYYGGEIFARGCTTFQEAKDAVSDAYAKSKEIGEAL